MAVNESRNSKSASGVDDYLIILRFQATNFDNLSGEQGYTPFIFYDLVMTLIESFRMFTQAYVMTEGGPGNASLFYVYYLFNNAFRYFRMGYACSLSWFLFFVIMSLTVLLFQSSGRWTYYETGGRF